ncbi:hypothetical protein [Pseudomonas sp. 2(2015)]|uniref:hypothetical protein n=1 Tax=Pseudomonas sp. 2(2015) TaxID=1619950 RepID=UPI0005EBDC4E|nr:hypothetical protein [Pseudomonas sp. 2(2015)]KJK19038.1 hypothetical protein UB48_04545 [Pseudomonas sp. 2(2015)]
MRLKLTPIRSDATLAIHKLGDVLTINGLPYDFGPLPDGATLPSEAIGCPWINQPVERINGVLVIPITMPHGAEAGERSRFPADIVGAPDGPIALPTDQDPKPTVAEATEETDA